MADPFNNPDLDIANLRPHRPPPKGGTRPAGNPIVQGDSYLPGAPPTTGDRARFAGDQASQSRLRSNPSQTTDVGELGIEASGAGLRANLGERGSALAEGIRQSVTPTDIATFGIGAGLKNSPAVDDTVRGIGAFGRGFFGLDSPGSAPTNPLEGAIPSANAAPAPSQAAPQLQQAAPGTRFDVDGTARFSDGPPPTQGQLQAPQAAAPTKPPAEAAAAAPPPPGATREEYINAQGFHVRNGELINFPPYVDESGALHTIETYKAGLKTKRNEGTGRDVSYQKVKTYDANGMETGEEVQAFSADEQGGVRREAVGKPVGSWKVMQEGGATVRKELQRDGKWKTIKILSPEEIAQLEGRGAQ